MDKGTFNFKSHELRTVEIEGEPWFCTADICRILYGRTAGLTWVRKKLDPSEQRKCDRTTLGMGRIDLSQLWERNIRG